MFAGVLTAYALFFTKENLLDVSIVVYLLPIVSMVVTLVLIRKNVSFEDVPGFERLSGLMVMIACSFAIALVIQKTRIWIVFGGSIDRLISSDTRGVSRWVISSPPTTSTARRRPAATSPKPA